MLNYPLTPTKSGDLSIHSDDRDQYRSRARLLLDIAPGERIMLPEFGATIQQFAPSGGFAAIEAELLRGDLEKWCIEPGETVEFTVSPQSMPNGKTRLQVSY